MKLTITIAASAMLVASVPALAQTTSNTNDPAFTTTQPVEDDNDFPWGLLGLLGLAGLIPRKHKNNDHIHTDTTARR